MPDNLCFTVRFTQPCCHGRRDGGEPEWPPSPLRLFQALVAASAARWNERQRLAYAVPALQWLEKRPCSVIVGPHHCSGLPFRIAVPNNDLDVWAGPLCKGKVPKKQPAELKTMKDIRPTHLSGEAVHYLYPLPEGSCPHREVLKAAARSITHLGWGIDMVVADADVITEADAAKLPGHRWRVVPSGGVPLRVPKAGTLDDLVRKHAAFLSRLSAEGFKPVPPLACFDLVRYHSPTADGGSSPSRPIAAFEIHRTIEDQEAHPGRSRFRPFHPVRSVATVAGMVRCAAGKIAENLGYSRSWVEEHILGHGEGKHGQATTDERLMFLPLPSITPIGISGIRRVLIVGWPGFARFADLRRRLHGAELIPEGSSQPVALLSQLSIHDSQVQNLLAPSQTWTTVTPVILPGFDDADGLRRKYRQRAEAGLATAQEQKHLLERVHQRTTAMLCKAFQQAGWTADTLGGTQLEYRPVGWLRGLDVARNYRLPPLQYPRYHVRVQFPRPIPGPLVIGAGRYRGMGLLAPTQ
jgi:CRISPR-associated protein Csb2